MKRGFLGLLCLALVVCLAACGGVAKKGFLTVNATGEDIDNYAKGFQKYFDMEALDASDFGGNVFTKQDSRYVVVVADPSAAADYRTPEGAFLIVIRDIDANDVKMSISYTVGAAAENPTVVNKNFLNGISDVTKTLNFSPKEKTDKALRAEQIASVLYDALKEIEPS